MTCLRIRNRTRNPGSLSVPGAHTQADFGVKLLARVTWSTAYFRIRVSNFVSSVAWALPVAATKANAPNSTATVRLMLTPPGREDVDRGKALHVAPGQCQLDQRRSSPMMAPILSMAPIVARLRRVDSLRARMGRQVRRVSRRRESRVASPATARAVEASRASRASNSACCSSRSARQATRPRRAAQTCAPGSVTPTSSACSSKVSAASPGDPGRRGG